MTNLFRRHPTRWPISPESGSTSFDGETPVLSICRHSNVDIGVCGDHFPQLFEENVSRPFGEREADETTLTPVASTSGQVHMLNKSINFSRPLVGRPSRHVALGLAEWSQDGELTQLIDSFPSPRTPGPDRNFTASHVPQADHTCEEVVFHNDVHSRHASSIEQLPPAVQNDSSILKINSQHTTPKTIDHLVKKKSKARGIVSSKLNRYTPYPAPHTIRLAKGSLEGLVRYRKLEKGELTPLPEIKRISSLMGSFKKFGLGEAPSGSSAADYMATSDAVKSNEKAEQPVDDEPSETPEGRQPFVIFGDSAIDAKRGFSSKPCENSHPNPLCSNPLPRLELSYARYLSDGRRPHPPPPCHLHHMCDICTYPGLRPTAEKVSVFYSQPHPFQGTLTTAKSSAEEGNGHDREHAKISYPPRPPQRSTPPRGECCRYPAFEQTMEYVPHAARASHGGQQWTDRALLDS